MKAIIPHDYEFDLYDETPYPGGLLTDWMVKTWNEGNQQLDTNPGVRLVDEDGDQKLYQEAIKSPDIRSLVSFLVRHTLTARFSSTLKRLTRTEKLLT